MNLLLDTSLLIDVLRRRSQRREFVADLVRAGHVLSTTTLNVAEVYAGVRPGEEPDIEALFARLHLYELSGPSARLAGKLKNTWSQKGRTLTLADTIVAAIAIEHECQLLTDNQKDFPMPEIQLYPLP
jgi:predicted nucleic acid-binding protein